MDTSWADQAATAQYAIHQYKDFAFPTTGGCYIQWIGQTNDLTNSVVLEVYNQLTTTWEMIDRRPSIYDSTFTDYDDSHHQYDGPVVNVDFELSASIVDTTNYRDGRGLVSCRVYQLAP